MNSKKPSLIDKIRQDIEKTGYPSELVVESTAINQGYDVKTHTYYVDREEKKSREIDLQLRWQVSDQSIEPNCVSTVRLYAEVKKSEKPWVIFSSKKSKYEIPLTGQLQIGHNTGAPMEILVPFEEYHLTHQMKRIGRSVHKSFTNTSSSIYSSIVSATKATLDGHSRFEDDEGIWDMNSKDACFYCPIVIFDGILFECYHDESGELIIKEIELIPFRFNYSSVEYHDNYAYHVDIITMKKLPEYLENIISCCKNVQENLLKTNQIR